ncbi:hypothetical protein CDCA_CDCA06G1818 [Cyanidium caldarium]|uniref:Pyridoxal phosphate homeostasis protein n=1 Tax=Cyanidium caldarium TaxID=2771 RepID=A0AAV9IUN0_CYACA|nr:hypothetical protein CDCA_CDCA06G1818 [Cyanidium caldarium]
MTSNTGIADRLQSVRNRIASAAQRVGRSPETVRLVAVGKTKPAALIQEAFESGQVHFGENYVQELVDKARQLPESLRWHFIGHLQTNKARSLLSVPNVWCVESVDRAKVASTLNRLVGELRGPDSRLNVMVQVNTSGEANKAGVSPEQAPELARYIATECPALHLLGLMTIGAPDDSDEPAAFRLLRETRERVQAVLEQEASAAVARPLELSMGMSDDFEAAVRMGSTNVRVGSVIFGARVYH